MKNLEKRFYCIPDSIQTTVYWYWVSGNISNEGVIKDLEAMKQVGINRAFIAHVTWGEKNAGKIKMFSNEWWDVLHTAFKTASRLGIEIGVFNCPGWSQSGGPWVKAEQSMRYLTSSEIVVQGPLALSKKLEKPEPIFQDVKVLAYPAPKGYGDNQSAVLFKESTSPIIQKAFHLTDGDDSTYFQLPPAKPLKLDFSAERSVKVHSVVITTGQLPTRIEGDIQIKEGDGYKTIKHFIIDRSNPNLKNGFTAYGPAVISIPAVSTKEVRLIFRDFSANTVIQEIKISSVPMIESYLEKTLAKMWPNGFVDWPAYQWEAQAEISDRASVIDPAAVVDISKYMSAEGVLTWQVPAGKWIVERTGMTPTLVQNLHATPEGTGLETDKMSTKHLNAHFHAFLGEIIRRIPADDRRTWKVVVADSYETGSQNWTDEFIEKFRAHYNYDPIPYMPVIQGKVIGSSDQSNRFLWDLRRFVADQVADQYVGGLTRISHQYGLTTWLENYGHYGFPGEFLQYGALADEVSGEIWNEGNKGLIENMAAASCAHIYGKNKVSAETFTTTDKYFLNYPATLKQRLDRSFAEGINNTLLHVYIHQPDDAKFPGMNAYFGTEFNRKNTWFNDMDDFVNYIKRCNLMLQQGKYVADVAYFVSEDAPKMTGTQEPALPHGYSCDYINADVIKNRLQVKDGELVLPDGMKYRILVLPRLKTMRPELLSKIKNLVKDGALVLGPRPLTSPSLQNFNTADAEIRRLSNELWGNINGSTIKVNHYGKGMVIDGKSLPEVFNLLKLVPDFKVCSGDSVLYIHRKTKGGEIYFITNQSETPIHLSPEFRVIGKVPELWDATTGDFRQLPEYKLKTTTTSVPIRLASNESVFIVFREPSKKTVKASSNYPQVVSTMQFRSKWMVQFDPKMGGPSNPVVFNSLSDWSKNIDDRIKFYSGAANYHNTMLLHKIEGGERVLLDLGKVTGIAKIKVNGIAVGGVWAPPYQIDITDALKPGKNELDIRVVNNWNNRLIGDQKIPEELRTTWIYYHSTNPPANLQPSGIMGPVTLIIIK